MLPKVKSVLRKKREGRVNLVLEREIFTDKSIVGRLYLNKEYVCDTLENPYINNKRNISCIPEGKYNVRLRLARESATRKYLHLLVQEVPNRSYILFHRGNEAKDTLGCILVGTHNQQDYVSNSKDAMDFLIRRILNLGGENIKLLIKNI
jgi:hypothetical protein|tara:strand:+ start:1360 stop:1809 length:450 start_codon:yes stop_codon:yes gene_type:complete